MEAMREVPRVPRRIEERDDPPGIVIRDGPRPTEGPAIVAFIWGGKVKPLPTLPFGRWKASTA